jgi:NitT/TauT family transport system substrate-binding protein
MQNRRQFLTTGFSIAAAGLAGAAALTGARRSLAEEAPPETTSLRLGRSPATCLAPLDILDDLLRDEGFADVNYVSGGSSASEIVARGEADFGQDFSGGTIALIDAAVPMVMLAGVHLGCFELFARESIRSVVELKGNKVGVLATAVGTADYEILSIVAASVGLNPTKDINWVAHGPRDQKELFADGEIDAFLAWPPLSQELRSRNLGRVILSSVVDRPWSQYFCCMLVGASDFVRRHPIATKRVVRAWSERQIFAPPNPTGSRNVSWIAASRHATTTRGRGWTTSPIALGATTTSKTRSASGRCGSARSA